MSVTNSEYGTVTYTQDDPRLSDPDYTTTDGTTNDPTYIAFTPREARTSYSAFQDVINKYRGFVTGTVLAPQLQISETHSPTIQPYLYTYCTWAGTMCIPHTLTFQNYTCEGSPYKDTSLSFLGARQSSAAAAGMIIRPFAVFGSLNANSEICAPIYPNPLVMTNGYDKTQP
jgi:hypothetical protein